MNSITQDMMFRQSPAAYSKRPHHHPNEHTPEEIALIRRFRKRNPELEITELWHRLKKPDFTRRVEILYRVMKRLGMLPEKRKKTKSASKPYERWNASKPTMVLNSQIVFLPARKTSRRFLGRTNDHPIYPINWRSSIAFYCFLFQDH